MSAGGKVPAAPDTERYCHSCMPSADKKRDCGGFEKVICSGLKFGRSLGGTQNIYIGGDCALQRKPKICEN